MNISKINKPMLSGPLAATSHFISKHFSDPTPFQRSADENWKINCGRYGSQMPSGDALVAGVELLGPRQLRPFRDLQTARQKRKPLTPEPLWSGSGERVQSLPKWKCTAVRHRSKRPDPATELDRNGNETGGCRHLLMTGQLQQVQRDGIGKWTSLVCGQV